jgi:hypothetical protein
MCQEIENNKAKMALAEVGENNRKKPKLVKKMKFDRTFYVNVLMKINCRYS